jgi:eukaryotic-like serine/threonine-protein kinase
MAILPGRRLGPYEILSAIGAGGMGEVYKARDTRLDRIVAIKVLPTHLADRSELRERFEREAKTIASLNHPHICTLYDSGHQDGLDFLVMEYLEGETLAQRLLKGPLSVEQVLQFAIEISDALDKAHRKGVTHRDLKPGNIMLTKTGTKLLDFGLAKLKQAAAPANVSLSDLPTANDPLTAQGSIVGTLQYMAPEQLEGREADARTDIFAFGAVVYEMATGKRAFEGKTQASVIGAILKDDPPPMSSLQPMTPPALDRIVKRCLAKDPDERCQSAKDLADELKWITEGSSQVTLAPTTVVKGIRALGRGALILSLGALLLGAAIATLALWNLKPLPLSLPVTRTVINLPPGQQLAGLDYGPAVALSPDGTQLAYVARQGGGTQQLYMRAMGSLEVKPIPGTESAVIPFFSPDGQWVGFFAGGKLKKVSVGGGAALVLGDAGQPYGASWGGQGMIAFAPAAVSALQQVSETGGPRSR